MNNIRWFVSFCNNKNLQHIRNSSNSKSHRVELISTFNNKNLVYVSRDSTNQIESYSNSNIDVLFEGFLWDKNKIQITTSENNNLKNLSQSQIIFYLYRKYGEDFINYIKGIFFIIIWDRQNDLVICYRDRMGFVPFFYNQSGDNYTFSTTIKGLLLNSSVKKTCNRAAIADHLYHRWPKEEETFYENIIRLRQGHRLKIKNNGSELSNYWNIDQKWIEENWVTEDIEVMFETILERSIKNTLEIGKNSIFLSGGLDSVSVGAYLKRICDKKLDYKPLALSLKFQHPECDEEEVQRTVAESLLIPQYITPLNNAYGAENLFKRSLEFNNKLSSPLLNFWLPGYYHLADKARSEGYDVILTGGGGDEWLGVNPYYMADLLSSYDFKGVFKFLINYHKSFDSTIIQSLYYSLFKFGVRPLLANQIDSLLPDYWKANRKERYLNSCPDWLAPDPNLKSEILSRASERFELDELKRAAEGKYGYYFRGIEEQYSHNLTSWEMEEGYEYSQSLNVTLYHPYWDSDMIEFLACIKPEHLNIGGRSKGIVRNLMSERFPQVDFKNQKKVNSVKYYFNILKSNYSSIDKKIKEYNSLTVLGIIDKHSIKNLMDQLQRNDNNSYLYHLWDICNAESWILNNFNDI